MNILIKSFLICGAMVCVFLLVYTEELKIYNQNTQKIKNTQKQIQIIKKENIILKQKYNKYKQENILSLMRFNQSNSNDIEQFLGRYLDDLNIQELNQTTVKDLFMVDANISNIKRFYYLLQDLKEYKNIIKIPHDMNISKHNDTYNLVFQVEIYKGLSTNK